MRVAAFFCGMQEYGLSATFRLSGAGVRFAQE
jgi:hypothetical protein